LTVESAIVKLTIVTQTKVSEVTNEFVVRKVFLGSVRVKSQDIKTLCCERYDYSQLNHENYFANFETSSSLHASVLESRGLVAISRPIIASLGLEGFRSRVGLEGYRSRSQAYCHKTLNTATMWVRKTSVIQRIFVCCICR